MPGGHAVLMALAWVVAVRRRTKSRSDDPVPLQRLAIPLGCRQSRKGAPGNIGANAAVRIRGIGATCRPR